jgi:hypothetical protein
MALGSGEYGGRKSGVRLAGTARSLATCQPARSKKYDRMGGWRHGLAELVEHHLHGAGADRRQDQGNASIPLGTDRAEQIGRLVAEVAHTARAQALLVPAPPDPAGLADPGLVQEPDLEPIGLEMSAGDLGDQRREFFLERTWAWRSASGWIGRAFCQDRSRSCSSRSMPFSL